MHACSVMSDSLQSHGLQPTSLCPWDFPGKNTGVVAISCSRGSSWPRDWIHVSCISCIGRWILYHWATREACIEAHKAYKSNHALYPCLWELALFLVQKRETFSLTLGFSAKKANPSELHSSWTSQKFRTIRVITTLITLCWCWGMWSCSCEKQPHSRALLCHWEHLLWVHWYLEPACCMSTVAVSNVCTLASTDQEDSFLSFWRPSLPQDVPKQNLLCHIDYILCYVKKGLIFF